jgi:hypothetical protein
MKTLEMPVQSDIVQLTDNEIDAVGGGLLPLLPLVPLLGCIAYGAGLTTIGLMAIWGWNKLVRC